jgi:uncharacterized repeat protein (TIGR01451 family)
VSVGAADVNGVDFSIAETNATLTLDKVVLGSAVFAIGSTITFDTAVTNWTASTATGIGVECYIDQGTISKPAGGTLIPSRCGSTNGSLPHGVCAFASNIVVSNSLSAGSATLRVTLYQGSSSTVLQTYTMAITLH